MYFHSVWKRENPTNGWAPSHIAANSREIQGEKALDAASAYVILETEGAGNYIGCNHSVTHFQNVSDEAAMDMLVDRRYGGEKATTCCKPQRYQESDLCLSAASSTMIPGPHHCMAQGVKTIFPKAGVCKKTRTPSVELLSMKMT